MFLDSQMSSIIPITFVILVILIVIVILWVINHHMTRYLNYNSTFVGSSLTQKSKFNPSDIYYTDNIELKTQEEKVKAYILDYLHAPDNAVVIFNSGASESIANMMWWAKCMNRFGTVVGSVLDHPTVEENAINMNVNYLKLNYQQLQQKVIPLPDNTSMVFITGVCPRTGEIYPYQHIKQYNYLNTQGDSLNTSHQFQPLMVLDASQMIGRKRIDMTRDKLNAVFFSCHKFGGEFNTGVLVISEPNPSYTFKPLIAGSQQDHRRGGTYNVYAYLSLPKLLKQYEHEYKPEECKQVYTSFATMLASRGLHYYKPQLEHTYNTVLLTLTSCNAKLIHELSEYGIYVGSSTACQHDNTVKELRISYLNKQDIGRNTVKKIVDIIAKDESDMDVSDVSDDGKKSQTGGAISDDSSDDIDSIDEHVQDLNDEIDFEDAYI